MNTFQILFDLFICRVQIRLFFPPIKVNFDFMVGIYVDIFKPSSPSQFVKVPRQSLFRGVFSICRVIPKSLTMATPVNMLNWYYLGFLFYPVSFANSE